MGNTNLKSCCNAHQEHGEFKISTDIDQFYADKKLTTNNEIIKPHAVHIQMLRPTNSDMSEPTAPQLYVAENELVESQDDNKLNEMIDD